MNNADFWASVHTIISYGFTPEGLLKLCRTGLFIIFAEILTQSPGMPFCKGLERVRCLSDTSLTPHSHLT